MTKGARKFGVVQWTSETDERLAAPGEKSRLLEHRVNGRVALLVGADGSFQRVRIGDQEFRISAEKIAPAEGTKYAVGDELILDGKPTKVKEVVWHYAKNQPFYLLDIDGKKSSKRYFNDDLK